MAEKSPAEVLRKPDWIPMYLQRLIASEAWKLEDYRFGWYMKLLFALADSDVPGYLPNDVRILWGVAGAKTERYFRERGGLELLDRHFTRTDDGLWIYNRKMLEVLHEQMGKITKRRKRSVISVSLSLQSIPKSIDQELFHKYVEMREKIKKPLTGYGITLAFKELEKLEAQGHDPNAVLNQSIFHSWQGLFPIRAESSNGHKSKLQENLDALDRLDI